MGRKQNAEQAVGRFAALPHMVMDSTAFAGASYSARALLLELVRQHTGKNNGHFQLSTGWLRRRGWTSSDMVQRAKAEVITRRLAIKTRLGGLNAGPDLWAVTWLPISDYAGLTEVSAMTYHPGAWHFMNPALTVPRNPAFYPNTEKRDERTADRNSAVPPAGTAVSFTVPPVGTKTALLKALPVPPAGNNEVTSSTGKTSARRVVGRKGASGIKPRMTAKVYRLVRPSGYTYAPKRKTA